jgi:hypothetical protein
MRRLVFTALALLMATPALAGAAAPVRVWNGKAAVARPAAVQYTGDGTGFLSKLKWATFGGATATAIGVDNANKCNPNCASGKFAKHPARVTLSKPITCKGQRLYTSARITVTGAGASGLSGRWPLYTRCSG